MEGIADQGNHLIESQLVKQSIPLWILIIQTDHIVKGQFLCCPHGRHFHLVIIWGIILYQLQILDQLICQGDLYGICRPGSFPVTTAEVSHILFCTFIEVKIWIRQLVGDLCTVGRNRIGRGIQCWIVPWAYKGCISLSVHTVFCTVALGCQNIVYGIMGIGCCCKIICTCI